MKVDHGAVAFLSFLQRVSLKVRLCKQCLDKFYVAELSADLETVRMHSADWSAKDTLNVLEVQPILVKHDRFCCDAATHALAQR